MSRYQWWAGVLGILAVSAAGWHLARIRARAHRDRPGLRVASEYLNIGEPWAQADFPWTLPVENCSCECIRINEFRVWCGCIAVEPTCVSIPPGQSVELRLRLDLRPTVADAGKPVYPFVAQVQAVLDSPFSGEVIWTLRGRVRTAFEVSPMALDFGESLVWGQKFTAKAFRVRCLIPGAAPRAECPQGLASVRVVSLDSESWHYEVEVMPNQELAVGEHDFVVGLSLAASDRRAPLFDGAKVAPFPVHVRARVFHPVRVVPDRLFLGAGAVGDVLRETVTLRSPVADFWVAGLETNCPELEATPVKGDIHQATRSAVYRIAQTVSRTGIQSGEIRFYISVGPGKSLPLIVPVSYEGFANRLRR